MKPLVAATALASLGLAGCSGWLEPPQSLGDVNAGFRYIAIDPLPVSFTPDFGKCGPGTGAAPGLLDALHDLAARVSTEQVSGEASVNIPVFSAGGSGSSYRVTQDFIAYDETPLRFAVPEPGPGQSVEGNMGQARLLEDGEMPEKGERVVTVPVYVGLGLRLTANVTVRRGNVNLADLGSLSAAAKADQVRGGLVVQSLGLNGTKVSAVLPMPGELNPTSIQHATVALGAMKALIEDPGTRRWPRVVGIHYPFATVDRTTVNAIVSALATRRLEWKPCESGGQSLRAY
ncbi:MAG TPA: hypothetical protein VEA61_06900 [Allosphingosinicella sp.]|nr:hypothetical protein [Allosphingosinicella sp.]